MLDHKDGYYYPMFKRFFVEESKRGNVSLNHDKIFPKLENLSFQPNDLSARQLSRFMEIWGKWETGHIVRDAIARSRSSELAEIARKWEEKTLIKFLQSCSNVALILPEYLIAKYRKLLRIAKTHHISIGQEAFPPNAAGVYLKGFIPPAILKRVKLSESSGIWEWHSRVIRPTFGSTSSLNPAEAKMTGHIAVIFIILPGGFAFAVIGLLLEMCLYCLRRIPVARPPRNANHRTQLDALYAMSEMLLDLAAFVIRQVDFPHFLNCKLLVPIENARIDETVLALKEI